MSAWRMFTEVLTILNLYFDISFDISSWLIRAACLVAVFILYKLTDKYKHGKKTLKYSIFVSFAVYLIIDLLYLLGGLYIFIICPPRITIPIFMAALVMSNIAALSLTLSYLSFPFVAADCLLVIFDKPIKKANQK